MRPASLDPAMAFLIGCVLAAISVAVILACAMHLYDERLLVRTGVEVPGTVVQLTQGHSRGGEYFDLRYAYQTPDGNRRVESTPIAWSDWITLRTGQAILVRYLADRPDFQQPVLPGQQAYVEREMFILLAMGAASCGVAGLLVWLGLNARNRPFKPH